MSVLRCPACGNVLTFIPGRGSVCTACGAVAPAPKPVYVLGLDLGQTSDFTALAALERSQGPDAHVPGRIANFYAVRHLERLKLGTPYPEMVQTVGERVKQEPLRGSLTAVDQTGVGRPVVDMLRQARLPIGLRPITITAGHSVTEDAENLSFHVPKKELVTTLQVLLQTGRLKIAKGLPAAKVLQAELLNFKVKITTAANETFGAWREGDHDDLVLAVALAAWVGERVLGGPFKVGLPPKGEGSVLDRLPEGVFGRR